MVALGMTPQQAIEAGTATAPRTLGPQAPRSGLLAEGYDADLITVDGTRWPTFPCSKIRTGSRRSGLAAARSKALPNDANDCVAIPISPALAFGLLAGSVHEAARPAYGVTCLTRGHH